MELVIDANIVVSALIADKGKTAELLFSDNLKLFAPEFLLKEIRKYRQEICAKSELSKQEFEAALEIISSRIIFIPYSEFKRQIQKAKAVSPDPNDVLYFALALKYDCPIWSNDKLLQNQKRVKILSILDVMKKLHK